MLYSGIGLNIKSKTSPVVYGSIEQLDDSFDNSGTAFETIISLSKFSNSSPPDKNAFSQYEPTPKVYWSLKEIKNENSEIKIWVRNRVGNKASKWVMVSGDSYKANFDVVSSDENGNTNGLEKIILQMLILAMVLTIGIIETQHRRRIILVQM